MIDPKGSYSYMIDGVPVDQGLGQQMMEDWQNFGDKKKQEENRENKEKENNQQENTL